MTDMIFDSGMVFEMPEIVSTDPIEAFSFDGPDFDYSVSSGGGYVIVNPTDEIIVTVEKRYIERLNDNSLFVP